MHAQHVHVHAKHVDVHVTEVDKQLALSEWSIHERRCAALLNLGKPVTG